jgi:hypothetical protein
MEQQEQHYKFWFNLTDRIPDETVLDWKDLDMEYMFYGTIDMFETYGTPKLTREEIIKLINKEIKEIHGWRIYDFED